MLILALHFSILSATKSDIVSDDGFPIEVKISCINMTNNIPLIVAVTASELAHGGGDDDVQDLSQLN